MSEDQTDTLNASYADWKGWDPARFGRVKARDAHYFGWHVRRALGARAGPLRVLEFGFGNGGFLGWARAQGHEVAGVEAIPQLVALARDAGYAAATSLQALDDGGRFDLIAGFDVLEHIPTEALPAFLGAARDRLGDDGRMLFRFPNGESPLGLVHQHADVTHVTVLGAERMRQLAPTCGLQLVAHGDALPWHARRKRSMPGAAIGALLRGGIEGALGRLYGMRGLRLTPNEIVVLARA